MRIGTNTLMHNFDWDLNLALKTVILRIRLFHLLLGYFDLILQIRIMQRISILTHY